MPSFDILRRTIAVSPLVAHFNNNELHHDSGTISDVSPLVASTLASSPLEPELGSARVGSYNRNSHRVAFSTPCSFSTDTTSSRPNHSTHVKRLAKIVFNACVLAISGMR